MNQPVRAVARDELILAAARLATSNSELWRQFLASIDGLLSVTTAELVQAGADIHNKQGRTQALLELAATLASCRENAEKIVALRQKQSAQAAALSAQTQR